MNGKSLFRNALLPVLRVEELIGLILIAFALLFGSIANLYIFLNHAVPPLDLVLNISRITVSLIFTLLFFRSIPRLSENRHFQIVRDFMPFIFVLIIYFNLQDAILIVHPQDIHAALVNLDGKLFGLQPTVWAEKFYHPRLTDWFALSYVNYYFMTLTLLIILYKQQRRREFRTIVLTMMISYFIGFVSYVIFPASSPYLVIPELYQVDIWQDTSFISHLTRSIVDLAPHRVRDAFPSMHNATVFLTMIMAWRYQRTFFWIQLPLALSLPFATVYLRYHYVVDILAALPVVGLALVLTPSLELKWKTFQNRFLALDQDMGESGINI